MSQHSTNNNNTFESKVNINKSLINNKFQSYKLNFDYIIKPVQPSIDNENEIKQNNNDNSSLSKKIRLNNQHQIIQIKHRITNLSKLNNIIKRNYLFMINNQPFYYDINGIFFIDIINQSIHSIYQFSKDDNNCNLSVCGCYNQQLSKYYIISSYSTNKLLLFTIDLSSKHINILFDKTINEINSEFIIQNAFFDLKQNQLFCNVINWHKNKDKTETFDPIIHILSFNVDNVDNVNNTKDTKYRIHCKLHGAKTYFNSFFHRHKDKVALWTISNGKFGCKDINALNSNKNQKNDIVQEPSNKKQRIDDIANASRVNLGDEIIYQDEADDFCDNEHAKNEYFDNSDWTMIQCFDLNSMDIIYSINFHDCVASKIMSINYYGNDIMNNDDDIDIDRRLCVIGCEFSHDMVVFALSEDNQNNGYSFKHCVTYPGLNMIAKSRKSKRGILITDSLQNVFIINDKQYISSFMNPGIENQGIQDSLQLNNDDMFIGYKLKENKLYCLTNSSFYVFHLPHYK